MKRSPRRSRGIAMVIVMAAVAVVFVIASGFLASQSTTMGIAQNGMRLPTARYLAESGIAMAMAEIRANPSWRTSHAVGPWMTDFAYGAGTISVRVDDGLETSPGVFNGNATLADDPLAPFTITSTGTVGGVRAIVKAQVGVIASNVAGQDMLMVVINPDLLSAADTSKKSRFESWGWNVTLIDDDASASDMQAAAASNSVVFISNSASDEAVTTKLSDVPVGVVTERKALVPHLKLASAMTSSYSQKQISITDTKHYITMVYSTGACNLFGSNQSMVAATSANVPGGATALAQKPSSTDRAMWVVDKDEDLVDGGAAGRRSVLPWADTLPNMSDFTIDGTQLLKRTVEWTSSLWPGRGAIYHAASSGKVTMANGSIIDSYDSSIGPYGGSNVGSQAHVVTNSISSNTFKLNNTARLDGNVWVGAGGNPGSVIQNNGTITGTMSAQTENVYIPAVAPLPTGFLANEGSKTFTSNTTFSTNRQFDDLVIDGAIVTISGHVTLRINKTLQLKSGGSGIVLNPGATLKIYAQEAIVFDNGTSVNANTNDPSRVIIYGRGAGYTYKLSNSAVVHAIIDGPASNLLIDNSAQLYGAWIGKELEISNSAGFHADTNRALAEVNPRLPMRSGTISPGTGSGGGSYTYVLTWQY